MSFLRYGEFPCDGCGSKHNVAVRLPVEHAREYTFECPATQTQMYMSIPNDGRARTLHPLIPEGCIEAKINS